MEKTSNKILFSTVNLLKKCENVIILPADNGLKMIVPIYNLFNKVYQRKLFYIVIGGFLPEFLRKNPLYVKMLNKYQKLFVQTPNLKKDLSELGVQHIDLMTNFKMQSIRKVEDIQLNKDENIKLCILSRLTKDKGIEDAIEAVQIVNATLGGPKVQLDLYGIVPEQYKERFNEIVNDHSTVVTYKGVANYNQTVSVLKNYYAMLFPTYFHGEGFAGCLIDAFFAGIPVIATDWLYNKDVVKDTENGLLVPIKNPTELAKAIIKLYQERDLAVKMAKTNVNEAKNYTCRKSIRRSL